MIGSVLIGEIEPKTNNRYKNVTDFKTYNNAIDNGGYDSDDVIFTGWLYKSNTPQFIKINRSQYGKEADFKRDNVANLGKSGYIPTSVNCILKCIKYFTHKDYTEELLTFIRTKQRRSNVMSSDRIQPFSRKHSINLVYFNGKEVWPGNSTRKI